MAETIKNGTYTIRAATRRELAAAYGVTLKTLNTWLNQFPALGIKKTKSILTPLKVKEIIQCIGEP